ncbi:MAG: phenylalanine--tRNA ligase subunit alpha [Pseudonocardiaceae bacterium]
MLMKVEAGTGGEALAVYLERALGELQAAGTVDDLAAWRRQNTGRSGEIARWRQSIGRVDPADRPELGRLVNEAWEALNEAFDRRSEEVQADESASSKDAVDVTLPPRRRHRGRAHPVMSMLQEIIGVFEKMGFTVFESPHVELDAYNFELLNMPPQHPARDMQDTFYVTPQVVLRTHTSAGQIRAMRAHAPEPLRVVIPGLCYRNEDVTPRSELQFFQVEGLMVGDNVRLSDLKGILLAYARHVYGSDEVRMRASYFPFTEPSVEIDIKCTPCHGAGCRVCKHTGWLELLGGGVVHPTVLRNGGYDPDKVSGIAWGMGVERQLLLRHEINDIRLFYRGDLRFLNHFS